MMDKEIIKKYSNKEITVVWKPQKCIHAAECVKELPNVYYPKEKPWIKIENASSEALKNQINKCPSGALSYEEEGNEEQISNETKVDVKPNGPLVVHGKLAITDKDGSVILKDRRTSFCRCGASLNQPFCDGSHKTIDFKEN